MNDRSVDHQPSRADRGHVAWRESRLCTAGFDQETASELAHDDAVDVHALLALVDRGCPPHLAARILAPLESRRTSP
jgi:hypothetical protein